MTRSVSILGSTGSVGRQTLDVIAHHGADAFKVVALSAHTNVATLVEQARAFKPAFVAIADEAKLSELRDALSDMPEIAVGGGAQALEQVATMDADITMAAIVGVAGLKPTMTAIARGKTVAFASKECLVAAGSIMMQAVKQYGTTFLPVDSEHNAIFQVLKPDADIRRIVLTASGGPFRDWPQEKLKEVTPAQATAHPTWSMGPKISVDSATLMNKALEVIEAHHLFALPSEKIDVVLHPQSTVHGMVEYADGSFLAQMGPADMRTPIAVCMGWPARLETPGARMDLNALKQLDFLPVDTARFPAMALVRDVLAGSAAHAITFNAANEVAVDAFLQGHLPFPAIMDMIAGALDRCHMPAIKTLDDVLACDSEIRNHTLNALKKAA